MQWVTHEVWLPDGRELAFVDWSHVVRAVYPATGSVRTLAGVQRLARGPEPRRQVDGGRHRSPQRRPAALPGARRAGSPHRLRIGRLDRGEPLLHRVRRDVRCENAILAKRGVEACLTRRDERAWSACATAEQDAAPRNNAVRQDASPVERSGAACHGAPGILRATRVGGNRAN